MGHLFYTMSSFVHHFKSSGEFKLELPFGNAQFRSKLVISLSRVTLKFDGWSWKTIGHLLYSTSSFVHHTLNFGQNWRFFALRDIEINQMTLKNNRTTFLYRVKLCASFQSHHWIQTGVTVWRRSIRVETGDFFALRHIGICQMTLKHNMTAFLYYVKLCGSFQSHHWIQTWVTARKCPIWVKIDVFCPVWPWNFTDDLEKQ